ncbi:cytochrome b [Xanthomonas medicagonis]|uniref:cytochrome b n=1 Tax=Xanthomonas medicagonis TaxID=3160841 RepID=UPI003515C1EA
MQWRNTASRFGFLAKLFHWTTAAAFIGAYVVVYYVIWCMDDTSDASLPVLNIHWALGLLVGFLVLPRLLWRWLDVQPDDPPGSALEHRLAHAAHLGLYALLIVMPLTGYVGTGAATDFGLFRVTGFNDTALFGWISRHYQLSWEAFEAPIDAVHHFIGKWIAWLVVALHVAAALFHHWVRRDDVLARMLPWRVVRAAQAPAVAAGEHPPAT